MRRGSGAQETDGPESVRRPPSLVDRRGAYATGGTGPVANTGRALLQTAPGGTKKTRKAVVACATTALVDRTGRRLRAG
jgi:hypothetical protein